MDRSRVDKLFHLAEATLEYRYDRSAPTEAEFYAVVEEVTQREWPDMSERELEELQRQLKSSHEIVMDDGVVLGGPEQQTRWFSASENGIGVANQFYWKRYKNYLRDEKRWSSRVIEALERASDGVMDRIGDPRSSEPFQRRGLILGDVQSGKTATYAAICNKAADAGYRVIIVLAGTMENLRQQTQERLNVEVAGLKPDQASVSSVGPTGRQSGRRSQGQMVLLTTTTCDFAASTANGSWFSVDSAHVPFLFVVKKNKTILNNILDWLRQCNPSQDSRLNMSLLLVDDEADSASINTKKDDSDPTAINKAIRELLGLFTQASYLGITATPYANIFIRPDTPSEMGEDDLFPRDFIYSLVAPNNYIGAESIFGDNASKSEYIEEIYPSEMDAYFPFGHKKELSVNQLPPSMKEAIAYFLLANGFRDVRGDKTAHRSMMIHVSRFTEVQQRLSRLVDEYLQSIVSDLVNYGRLNDKCCDAIENLAFLKQVWVKHGWDTRKVSDNRGAIDWTEFRANYLISATKRVEVRSVNQKSKSDGLDYRNHQEEGLRVIAVGGNSLSRGLTLEGLCVSYFYRKSQMYDTLLQMGRWFGYRTGYEDLCKIWISVEAVDWYGYITAAATELKQEIAQMSATKSTPREFGLKVRQDPASLIVTARNKMRSATPVTRPITISGRLLETPRLFSDAAVLEANERVFREFVSELPADGIEKLFWNKVSKSRVAKLIRSFKTHPWHLSFQGAALAEFIDRCGELEDWDVFLAHGESANGTVTLACGGKQLSVYPEKRLIRATADQISISGTKVRVGAGGVTKNGLSAEQCEAAKRLFMKKSTKQHVPDSAYLRIKRPPLLMLHTVLVDRCSPKSQIDAGVNVPDYVYALGIGIPDIGRELFASYVVNAVELRNYCDLTECEDE